MNLDNLNDMQKKAVLKTDGPLLVLAGAGSGKTKVLTTKIAYLIIEKNVDPSNILAITFTNKAAKEMKDRVINMLGPSGYLIQISTFHSFGLTIMKENYEHLGYDKNFTILDSDDSLTIIKKILKDMNLDVKQYNPRAIRNQISGAKNNLLSPNDYEKYANTDFEKKVLDIYKKYQTKLYSNNSLDFDDLLMLPLVLFEKKPDILKNYQEKYKYILIDEYQDTNEAQYILAKKISAKYKNICVVGDENQSIYSFRGSNYKNILNFEKDYKNSEVILLEENYRSTQNILNAANNIIKNNTQRKDKKLWTGNNEGTKIKYKRLFNEKEEATFISDEINNLLKKDVKENEIAILYRTNAQSRTLEESLLKNNIPYKVVGSFYFYNRKEIKDLISYLKLIYNPKDDISLTRIINVPKRGIGTKTLSNLGDKAYIQNKSLFDTIDSGKEFIFKQTINNIIKKSESLSLTELIDLILNESGIKEELLSEKTVEAEIRLENLEEFKSITKSFEENRGIVSLSEFLEEISLVADVEEHKNNKDVVTLMTIHASKGLEFDYVFLAGVEEGIMPHSNSFISLSDIEEERRLCYVAVTRAKKTLYLLNAKKRMLFGNENYNPVSRFINEIEEDYLENDNKVVTKEIKKFDNKLDMDIIYNIGDKVMHDIFGLGVIITIDKSVLTIAFPHPNGIKKLMKGHKSIRKVD